MARSVTASVLPVLAHPLLNNLGTAWGGQSFYTIDVLYALFEAKLTILQM